MASTHGSTVAALARATAALRLSAVGAGASFFSGATASTTRFSSVMNARATFDTSSSVTVGQIGGGDAVFEFDAGNRFPAQEVADVLAGVVRALAGRAFVIGALVGGKQRAPRAIELRGAEAELLHAPGLEHDGFEAGRQSVLRHGGANLEQLERAAEAVGAGFGGHERRIGPAGNLAQARVEHLAHELPHQGRAIVARPSAAPAALLLKLSVTVQPCASGSVATLKSVSACAGHGAVHGLDRRRRTRDAVEARAHQLLGFGRVEIADHHHRHLIRPVPFLVERHEALARRALDHLGRANRQPLGIARALQQDRQLLVGRARARRRDGRAIPPAPRRVPSPPLPATASTPEAKSCSASNPLSTYPSRSVGTSSM